ncbi:polyphosphate:AMP phosphotransferase [Pelagibius litoralis]|uniref:Polyphosphate:AMP phosphotransferase n=1 Tax=Pelagibius litoralis TaxID=374515 RepID=A0A967F1C0_9PROT|nr:polyphosphate:AMP phosphotransferase [Pelagibius litoralis]NIA71151.1 polyphosphate:AMP phosphotransferase [Pelagibius litoralis]
MFETAELGRTISKAEFKKTAPVLREELLELQYELHRGGPFQVLMVFAGVDGAGKGETVSLLNAWMDPRWLITRAYDEAAADERDRPEFWCYWRDLPPRGQIGMFLSAWYHRPVLERVYEQTDEATFLKQLDRINRFEHGLARDGALILKFWMHLSRDAQEKRLTSLENDPLTKARVTERDWQHLGIYDRFIDTAELVISRTNRGVAPWTVVEGADPNYRSITVPSLLRDALERRLREVRVEDSSKAKPGKASKKSGNAAAGAADTKTPAAGRRSNSKGFDAANAVTVLSQLDMSKRVTKATYKKTLAELQARLHALHLRAKTRKMSSILVFEGPDAAGKGGAIRRVNEALDARNYQVYGIAAPTDEELAQHYLWRFWRRLSRDGHITIFDRSWYGRALVERIEGFASEDEWRRSYGEINDFEEQLIDHGTVLVKYWVHITKEEQLARFKLRDKTPYKRWKLTEEDWRNRDRWGDYEQAVNDMVQYTSTSAAPWTLVEGNDKRFARLKVVKTFCDRLAAALGDPPG